MKKKKSSKTLDFNNIEDIIKLLNNKKTTLQDVLEKLQDIVEKFQHIKEDHYIENLKQQIYKEGSEVEDKDLETYADKIQQLVLKDTKHFVAAYVNKMNDSILDAINEKKLKKDPGHAFLILLQTMEMAFEKT